VIASRAGAIPEATGEGAMLFTPGNVEQLALAMKQILTRPSMRQDLQRRGLIRASECRWDESAALMDELLVDAASRPEARRS
jgi:glycosyltransferase involved in cell wall biosynthesis